MSEAIIYSFMFFKFLSPQVSYPWYFTVTMIKAIIYPFMFFSLCLILLVYVLLGLPSLVLYSHNDYKGTNPGWMNNSCSLTSADWVICPNNIIPFPYSHFKLFQVDELKHQCPKYLCMTSFHYTKGSGEDYFNWCAWSYKSWRWLCVL